jgi:ribosome-binding factor A
MEETNRQKKIAGVIQKDLVDVLQGAAQAGMQGVLISVTRVRVTTDLSQAQVFLSIFPSDKRDALVTAIQSNAVQLRHELAQRTKHQLRRVPNLTFYGDDSLDYIEKIDASLRGEDTNPIQNPEILPKRNKS